MKVYKVGKYIRLSSDSRGYHRNGEDSASIENQDAMLSKFIDIMPGWTETRTYIDDGVSGANFDRRGFRNMMDDVRSGIINLVIVKDLSRFGRNYLETGRYLEEELPALGCRFVALSDGIDTESGENDILPFINAINDFYVRDVSRRIKSVMHAKAKEGHKLSGTTPYGYDRHDTERHRLVVDRHAAEVVRKMFALRAIGMGYSKVAGELNKEGVLPPRLYYFKQQGRETTAITTEVWTSRTVKLILCNELYLGHTVSLKRGIRSYRDKYEYRCDESEWIRVENTHPAIIDNELWDKVQTINNTAKKKGVMLKAPQRSLFSGLLVCSDCGAKMGYFKRQEANKNGKVIDISAYGCITYTCSGGTACSTHRIMGKNLKSIVLEHIKETAAQIEFDEDRVVEKLMQSLVGNQRGDKAAIAKGIRTLEQQLYSFDNQIDALYEDKISGFISTDKFSETIQQLEADRTKLERRLFLLTESAEEIENKLNDTRHWTALIREKSTIIEVDRELLEALINKIEIGARVKTNGVIMQDVRIFFKYVGYLPK
ncbi:MAG: recombinase family protein [Oscillospiraceae bacterium]|nr:recombinase family protein [Oscillospiraceae bacterium]